MRLIVNLAVASLSVAVTANVALASQYFIEAEDYAAVFNTPELDPSDFGNTMSGGHYLKMKNNDYTAYDITANSIPAGTYYIAERGYSVNSQSRGLGIDVKNGATGDITQGYAVIPAFTFNSNNSNNAFEWKWAYTDFSSSTLATLTIVNNQAISLRMGSIGSSADFPDVFALLSEAVLPSNTVPDGGSYISTAVPEPASLGLLGVVGLAVMRRRRSA